MRQGVAGRSSAAATSTLPAVSLYAPATGALRVREIGIFNSTAVAFVASVRRLSSTGTQGAGITEFEYDTDGNPVIGTAYDAHSVAPTLVAGIVRYGAVGAAIGAGYVWTFGDSGLVIPSGGVATNGIGILCPTGTGQIFDYYIDWDE